MLISDVISCHKPAHEVTSQLSGIEELPKRCSLVTFFSGYFLELGGFTHIIVCARYKHQTTWTFWKTLNSNQCAVFLAAIFDYDWLPGYSFSACMHEFEL